MIFFGSLLRSPHPYSEYSSFRALLHVAIERLCQRYKLALSLAVCLCLAAPVHASHPDVLLEAKTPKVSVATDTKAAANKVTADKPNDDIALFDTPYNEDTLTIENVKNINGLAPASLWQPELSEPSLYALLDAEFAADRDDKRRAVSIYKQQSFKEDATAVFERALSLSLRNERVEDSLQFAKTWQDQNPDHVPAWF